MRTFPSSLLIFLFLICSSGAVAASPPPPPPQVPAARVLSHMMFVQFDLEGQKIEGVDRITVEKPPHRPVTLRLVLRSGSNVTKVVTDGFDLDFSDESVSGTGTREIAITLPGTEARLIEMDVIFYGQFKSLESAKSDSTRGVSYVDYGVIGEEGAYLPSMPESWYPRQPGEIAFYDVTISTPSDYDAVMEGEWVSSKVEEVKRGRIKMNRWKSVNPLESINIVVGKYDVRKKNYKGINIYTFFSRENKKYSRTYIKHVKRYIDMYHNNLFPTYPYSKFAVVESPLATGFGFPSFTMLGSEVLKLPFIPETSLGHEFVHNWWGNSVFQDRERGGWVEGLTVYTSDQLYAEQKGEGADYRFNNLLSYVNNPGSAGLSLSDITDATESDMRPVLYAKGAMFFNMLENTMGRELFYKALRGFYWEMAFKRATWEDMERVFENLSRRELSFFFDQWIRKPSAPKFLLSDVSSEVDTDKEDFYRLGFVVTQEDDLYQMSLPISIRLENSKEVKLSFVLKEQAQKVELRVPGRPVSFVIDLEYENMRTLYPKEVPPSLSSFLGDKDAVFVVPTEKGQGLGLYAGRLSKEYGQKVVTSDKALEMDLSEHSVFIVGTARENPIYDEFKEAFGEVLNLDGKRITVAGKDYPVKGTIVAVAVKNPLNTEKTVCLVIGEGLTEKGVLEAARRTMFNSGKSYLVFKKDGELERGKFRGSNALSYSFEKTPAVITPSVINPDN